MTPAAIGIIGIIVLLLFLYGRMWIGFAMIVVGFWGIVMISGFDTGLGVLGTVPYRKVANYPITALPLFILMGVMVSNTGVGADLYYTAHKWIGQLRGGLAMATVAACAAFAAMSGSSSAGTLTMGKIALPEMKKFHYDDRLATGCIAAGGTMGILIPPSLGFILYGILTETSVGHLFMAGIIPGILEAVFYMVTIYVMSLIDPKMGPPGPKYELRNKISSLRNTWPMIALFLLVIGGIYLGVFTPTEAGAVGAFGAIIISLITGRLRVQNFKESVFESAVITAMMIFLISGVFVFVNFMALSKLHFVLGDFIVGLNISKYLIIIVLIFIYIVLGMFLDVLSCIVLTVPIFFPIVVGIGLDPIWYGVLMVRVMEIGMITPPIGINVFLLAGIADTPIGTIFRGVLPFVLADFVHVALLVAVPSLSLFLPSTMMA